MKKTEDTMAGVALLIPVYNEGRVIKQTIDQVPQRFTRIVCVNDGSTDNTLDELQKTRAEVVSHSINLGQGAALQTAIDYALLDNKTKYFVTYDADGQHSIKDVERMVQVMKNQKIDVVLGSRFLETGSNVPLSKKVMLKLATTFTRLTTGVKVSDTHNGLRVLSRRAAEVMNLTMPDFAHASEIIERIAAQNLSYTEVPVTITYSDYSRSKGQSMINSINIAFDVILNRLTK